MSFELERHVLPKVNVYVQAADRSLQPASSMLQDDLRADLIATQARILDEFGAERLPGLEPETAETINAHFSSRNWSRPPSVVINPDKDAKGLRAILQQAQFPSSTDMEFFTGANGQAISPGGMAGHDIVIFHDWRDKYRKEINTRVTNWGFCKADDEL